MNHTDPSVVPSYLLSREIAKKYKVAISGDGGDELLEGIKNNFDLNKASFFKNLFLNCILYPAVLGIGNKLLSNLNNLERFRSF